MRRLQKRVRDLEDEISRLQAQNDQLSMAVTDVAASATDREPALA
ncbi:prefoldin subunit 5 [Nocardiopsis metallicus]|uniref:Prefoldin subunit 5 n=2 Tax=Nocardiopsis TaxID=2013 RepID=A0A840WUX5_9ACTN|nr:prefoldin subunit 5 [Nocardiopsis metallicus]